MGNANTTNWQFEDQQGKAHLVQLTHCIESGQRIAFFDGEQLWNDTNDLSQGDHFNFKIYSWNGVQSGHIRKNSSSAWQLSLDGNVIPSTAIGMEEKAAPNPYPQLRTKATRTRKRLLKIPNKSRKRKKTPATSEEEHKEECKHFEYASPLIPPVNSLHNPFVPLLSSGSDTDVVDSLSLSAF